MKSPIAVVLALTLAACGSARVRANPALDDAPEIVWLGIDYTGAKFVGVGAFNDPDAIFPGYLKKWNALFLEEMLVELRSALGKPVRAEVTPMLAHNERARATQIVEGVELEGENLTAARVASLVRAYRLPKGDGVGLVFVMDALLKHQGQACLWPTFIDLRSREVLETRRQCHETGGIGFRNFWFNPIKEAVDAF